MKKPSRRDFLFTSAAAGASLAASPKLFLSSAESAAFTSLSEKALIMAYGSEMARMLLEQIPQKFLRVSSEQESLTMMFPAHFSTLTVSALEALHQFHEIRDEILTGDHAKDALIKKGLNDIIVLKKNFFESELTRLTKSYAGKKAGLQGMQQVIISSLDMPPGTGAADLEEPQEKTLHDCRAILEMARKEGLVTEAFESAHEQGLEHLLSSVDRIGKAIGLSPEAVSVLTDINIAFMPDENLPNLDDKTLFENLANKISQQINMGIFDFCTQEPQPAAEEMEYVLKQLGHDMQKIYTEAFHAALPDVKEFPLPYLDLGNMLKSADNFLKTKDQNLSGMFPELSDVMRMAMRVIKPQDIASVQPEESIGDERSERIIGEHTRRIEHREKAPDPLEDLKEKEHSKVTRRK